MFRTNIHNYYINIINKKELLNTKKWYYIGDLTKNIIDNIKKKFTIIYSEDININLFLETILKIFNCNNFLIIKNKNL